MIDVPGRLVGGEEMKVGMAIGAAAVGLVTLTAAPSLPSVAGIALTAGGLAIIGGSRRRRRSV